MKRSPHPDDARRPRRDRTVGVRPRPRTHRLPASLTRMSASPQKLSFDTGGAFIRDTRRDVEQYLADRRVRAGGRRRLHAKAILALGLAAGCWAMLMLGAPGVAFGLACSRASWSAQGSSPSASCTTRTTAPTSGRGGSTTSSAGRPTSRSGSAATHGGSSTTSPTTPTRTSTATTPTSPRSPTRACCPRRRRAAGIACSTSTSGRSTR